MNHFTLVPQLRENCIIEAEREIIDNFSVGDVIYLISDNPAKKFSIISKIEGKSQNSGEPKILIDKRILGKLNEEDKVKVLKYNPAEAIEVRFGISEEYTTIASGDWTSTIKESLLNKLIDLGQEISFIIPWEGGAPIIGIGIVKNTLPNPPVVIGARTTIYLEKQTQEELSELKKAKIREQTDRVDILEEQIKHNTLDIITKIKHGNYPNQGQKYKFTSTNPQKLFDSLQDIFKGLNVIETPYEKTYDSENQDYFASVVYFLKKEGKTLLIDIQIMASENSGKLLIWITGKDNEIIQNTLKLYDERVIQLKEGLEEKVEIMNITCPDCGAELPIKNMDINGMIECEYCNSISRIPKAMRY